MTRRTAVVVFPGRGTYGEAELGYIRRHHGPSAAARFDAIRAAEGQVTVSALDGAASFDAGAFADGAAASSVTFAAAWADWEALTGAGIDVVAVTGNSMGWYIAIAAAGVLDPEDAFGLVNLTGRLMTEDRRGGQLLVPLADETWRVPPGRRAYVLAVIGQADGRDGAELHLSIDLGASIVLGGSDAGLAMAETALSGLGIAGARRLPGHAAFHTPLQDFVPPVARRALPVDRFGGPRLPLVDGTGRIWAPDASPPARLRAYTLGAQIVAPYDFGLALTVAAREFAPDVFVLTGPGGNLGGAIGQALIGADWRGLADRQDMLNRQRSTPVLLSMGRPDQRARLFGD